MEAWVVNGLVVIDADVDREACPREGTPEHNTPGVTRTDGAPQVVDSSDQRPAGLSSARSWLS
jgi:hypothetical protein